MTTTYDQTDPSYLDEASVRAELTRVFDICQGCRRCTERCGSFPTLFEMIDRRDDRDAGMLTPEQQDRVLDECFHCKLCAVGCPYAPARHESSVDMPRLMLRAEAMRRANGQRSVRRRTAGELLGRVDLLGKAATMARIGPVVRGLVAMVGGASSVRMLPPFAKQRFSTWFGDRAAGAAGVPQRSVTIFPTCLVEYHATDIGQDLVRVYEHNGIDCAVSAAGCCGWPSLHTGDVGRFAEVARRNVATLAAEVRLGRDVVVPQPTCGYVLEHHYLDAVGDEARADAELVARHTYDAAEYLMQLHVADDGGLDTGFGGAVPEHVTYHVPCHLEAQEVGVPGRDLMQLTGAAVTEVRECSGCTGGWGPSAAPGATRVRIAERLGERITEATGTAVAGDEIFGDAIAGDCHLANQAIARHAGSDPVHPVQLVARAYGLPDGG